LELKLLRVAFACGGVTVWRRGGVEVNVHGGE